MGWQRQKASNSSIWMIFMKAMASSCTDKTKRKILDIVFDLASRHGANHLTTTVTHKLDGIQVTC